MNGCRTTFGVTSLRRQRERDLRTNLLCRRFLAKGKRVEGGSFESTSGTTVDGVLNYGSTNPCAAVWGQAVGFDVKSFLLLETRKISRPFYLRRFFEKGLI